MSAELDEAVARLEYIRFWTAAPPDGDPGYAWAEVTREALDYALAFVADWGRCRGVELYGPFRPGYPEDPVRFGRVHAYRDPENVLHAGATTWPTSYLWRHAAKAFQKVQAESESLWSCRYGWGWKSVTLGHVDACKEHPELGPRLILPAEPPPFHAMLRVRVRPSRARSLQ